MEIILGLFITTLIAVILSSAYIIASRMNVKN